MLFTHAIARTPGDDFALGLTKSLLGAPDMALTRQQHTAYCEALRSLGLELTLLPPAPGLPDATFVEDTAVMIPGAAVITRLGTDERRGETDSMRQAIAALPEAAGIKAIHAIEAPGTVEGGDVMEMNGHFFIGLSERTNEEGARQLGSFIEAAGGSWTPVPVVTGLHLKTSVNFLSEDTLVMTEPFADLPQFESFKKIVITEDQLPAANCIRIGSKIVMASGYPTIRQQFQSLGFETLELDMSEYTKMDGGLSCLSLRF